MALYTTSSGYTGSRNSSIHSTWQGSSTHGLGKPASSQGSDMPGSGSRSSYQIAFGSNFAENTFPIHSSSLHCKNRKTNASVPWTSCTPTTSTLPGVQDIDGPRAVRHSPLVDLIASEYNFCARTSGTLKYACAPVSLAINM